MDQYRSLATVYDDWVGSTTHDKMHKFLLERGLLSDGIHVVDLCCGTGVFALLLATDGAVVQGVDASREMLSVARARVQRTPFDVCFTCADIATTGFEVPRADLVTCMFDSVNYLSEAAFSHVAMQVHTALTHGGAFVFDINTPFKLKTIFGNSLYKEERADFRYTWKNTQGEGWVDFEINLEAQANGRTDRSVERHRQYVHEPDYLYSVLRAAGFTSVDQFDDYEAVAPSEKSERVAFVARKPA